MINCQAKGLNDTKAGHILNSFFLPTVTTVRQILMNSNQLTHVPTQIFYLRDSRVIDLSFNHISKITKGLFYDGGTNHPGDCHYAATHVLNLQNNQISYIEPGSLLG